MKSNLSIALALLAILASCATDPGEPVAALVEEVPVAEEAVEVPAEPEIIIETVYLVSVERSFFADGTLDEYEVWTYKEDSLDPLSRIRFDSLDVIRETSTYTYRDNVAEVVDADAEGSVTRTRVFTYSPEGLLLEERIFDETGTLQTVSSYGYENGRRAFWEVFDGSEVLRSTTVYSYQGDRLVRIDNYSPGGVLEDYFLLEYDGENLVREEYFFDGELEEYVEFEYDGDKLINETVYRGRSTVQRRREYVYDGDVVAEILLLGRGGELRSRTTFEYLERIQETVAND